MKTLFRSYLLIFLLYSVVANADEKLYFVDHYVILDDGTKLSKQLQNEIVQDEENRKIKQLEPNKTLRQKILKALNIREDDVIFVKFFDEKKSAKFMVSDLKIRTETNFAVGQSTVYGVGFSFPEKLGIASMAKINPFNDEELVSKIKPNEDPNTYSIDSNMKFLTSAPLEPETPGVSGDFDFEIQIGDEKPVSIGSAWLGGAMDVARVTLRAGKPFKDDTILIHLTNFNWCGKFFLIKNGKTSNLIITCKGPAGC